MIGTVLWCERDMHVYVCKGFCDTDVQHVVPLQTPSGSYFSEGCVAPWYRYCVGSPKKRGGAKKQSKHVPLGDKVFIMSIEGDHLPLDLYRFSGKRCKKCDTNPDGACAIHSVFGTLKKGEITHDCPRELLRRSFGSSWSEFQGNVNDWIFVQNLKDDIFKDCLKPGATSQQLGSDEKMLWRR